MRSRALSSIAAVVRVLARADPFLYPVWAAALTLASARSFYGYLLKQTGGEWSAPLDDVFIHFDYARATAKGHPFEWTVGNGYSSGNTSLTYPFVLAAGWLAGFKDRELMVWAAIVAMVSVFGVLLAARPLFFDDQRGSVDGWGRLSSYLLPPVFLGVGALDWSLWSGMEVAFFLGTWAIALVAWRRLEARARRGSDTRRASWLLGLSGALLVTTRPEAALTIGIFGLAAATVGRRATRPSLGVLVRAGLPAAVMLFAQAVANRALTGEWSANGAIVKLALNNPYMTAADKYADWLGNLKYACLRNLDYHFAHIEGEHMKELVPEGVPVLSYLARTAWWAGMIPLAIATLPLAFARTRRIAVVLWAQMAAWQVLVALNGQVRWQNERYTMPAVAWMLILTALGASEALRFARRTAPSRFWTVIAGAFMVQTIGVLTRPAGSPQEFRLSWILAIAGGMIAWRLMKPWGLRAGIVALALLFAWDHQIPKMRDQKWFFGRASRNIRDQHLTLGKYVGQVKPNRVLVGDAGAILYESDLPGLDIIGLGGFQQLPFARAGVQGLPATLELIERMPKAERPELLAIFPTWWGVLPQWFASDVMKKFPVEGNVICGGYEQNVYKADWSLLDTGARMRFVPHGEQPKVEVDVGDLVSERANGYVFATPSNGWTDMRVLPDPTDSRLEMFDGGRRIAVGRSERFVARALTGAAPAHLVVRSAPEKKTRVKVIANGVEVGGLDLDRTGGWTEDTFTIPAEKVTSDLPIELVNEGPGDFLDYHLWVTQR